MPGLEPGIQTTFSDIIPRTTALDARVKSAHDEAESAALLFRAALDVTPSRGPARAPNASTPQIDHFLSCAPQK
jgi:hypothetical protein